MKKSETPEFGIPRVEFTSLIGQLKQPPVNSSHYLRDLENILKLQKVTGKRRYLSPFSGNFKVLIPVELVVTLKK